MRCVISMHLRLCRTRRDSNLLRSHLCFNESAAFRFSTSRSSVVLFGRTNEAAVPTTSCMRYASSFHSKERPLKIAGVAAERSRLVSHGSVNPLGSRAVEDGRRGSGGPPTQLRQHLEKNRAATDAARHAIVSCSSSSAVCEAADLLLATDRKKLYAVHRPTSGLSPQDYTVLLEKLRHHHDGDYARRVFALLAELLEKPLHPQAGGGTPWDVDDLNERTAAALALAMGSMSPQHALEFADEYFQLSPTLADSDKDSAAVVSAVFTALKNNVVQPDEPPKRRHSAEIHDRGRRSVLLTNPDVIAGVTAALIRERTPSSVTTALELLDLAAKARLRGIPCFTEKVATEAAEAAATVGDVEVVTRIAFLLYRAMGALGNTDGAGQGEVESPPTGDRSKRSAVASEASGAFKNSHVVEGVASSSSSSVWSLWSHIGTATILTEADVVAPTRGFKGKDRNDAADPASNASFELAVVRLLKSVMHASLFNPHHRQPGADAMAADAAALKESQKLFCGLIRGSSLEAATAMAVELLDFVADRPWLSLLTVQKIIADLQKHAATLHHGRLSESQQVLVSHCLRRAMECHTSFIPIGLNDVGKTPLRFPVITERSDSAAATAAMWVLNSFAALTSLQRASAPVVSLALAATCVLRDAQRSLGLVEEYVAANKGNVSCDRNDGEAMLRSLDGSGEEHIMAALLMDSAVRTELDSLRHDSTFFSFPLHSLFSCATSAQWNVFLEELFLRSDYPSPKIMERLADAFHAALPQMKDSRRTISRMVAILAHQRSHIESHMPQTRRTLDLLYTLLSGLNAATALTPVEVVAHLLNGVAPLPPAQGVERTTEKTRKGVVAVVVVDASVVQHALEANRSLAEMITDVFGSNSANVHYVFPWNTLVALSDASYESSCFHNDPRYAETHNTRKSGHAYAPDLDSHRPVERANLNNTDSLIRLLELGRASALIPQPITLIYANTQDGISAATATLQIERETVRFHEERYASFTAAVALRTSMHSLVEATVSLWVEDSNRCDAQEMLKVIANECRTHSIEVVSLRRAQTKRASAALRHILPLQGGKTNHSTMTTAPRLDPSRPPTNTREFMMDCVRNPHHDTIQQPLPNKIKYPSR